MLFTKSAIHANAKSWILRGSTTTASRSKRFDLGVTTGVVLVYTAHIVYCVFFTGVVLGAIFLGVFVTGVVPSAIFFGVFIAGVVLGAIVFGVFIDGAFHSAIISGVVFGAIIAILVIGAFYSTVFGASNTGVTKDVVFVTILVSTF